MKTLSDDLTLKLATTGMSEGYVITTIYHNEIGIFSGHSWIPGNNSSLYVNVNDFAIQNRGKYDYLKLNDNGEVESVQMHIIPQGQSLFDSRFNNGQIGTYMVDINDGSTHQYNTIDVVTGYDYPNRDLRPLFILTGTEDSSLCRIMQGCDWIYNHDDEIGNFRNLLLPHYPAKITNKYGMGLQIWETKQKQYALQAELSGDINLGYAMNYADADMTFIKLDDLLATSYTAGKVQLNSDKDTSVYLKEYGTSGDEFGDWVEGFERYKGHLSLDGIQVSGFKDGVETDLGEFDEGATFRVYVTRYIGVTQCGWNLDALMAGDRDVYITDWKRRSSDAYDLMDVYEDNYGPYEIPRSSIVELQYDRLIATPVYTQEIETETIPDKFIGTCPVAIFDHCYSRYYLAWNDGYGDIMSQAFDGKIEFSESLQNKEIKDYKLRRRLINKTIQPKWKLNTKWLNEDVYPIYESIFTSPYLLLYDTETDRSWNVILTDTNYTEKTFKTEKKLFNLELSVEANTCQNMIF